jgi:hypothetical protein
MHNACNRERLLLRDILRQVFQVSVQRSHAVPLHEGMGEVIINNNCIQQE